MANSLKSLARPERFELPTHGFVVRCSIQAELWARIICPANPVRADVKI